MAEDVIDRVLEVYMYKLNNKDDPDNNDNSNDNANKKADLMVAYSNNY